MKNVIHSLRLPRKLKKIHKRYFLNIYWNDPEVIFLHSFSKELKKVRWSKKGNYLGHNLFFA